MSCLHCDYCCHTLDYEVYTDMGLIKPHECNVEREDYEKFLAQQLLEVEKSLSQH